MPTRVEWHKGALEDVESLDKTIQQRITDAIGRLRQVDDPRLRQVDDPRLRLVPYVEGLKGYWKLRVGDYRVVCELRRDGERFVMVIRVVNRNEAYLARNVRIIRRRSDD